MRRGQDPKTGRFTSGPDHRQDTITAVMKMVDDGLTFTNTAKSLGLTRGQVAGIVYRYTEKDEIDVLDPEAVKAFLQSE